MNKDEAVLKLARQTLISIAHAEDLYDSFFEKTSGAAIRGRLV